MNPGRKLLCKDHLGNACVRNLACASQAEYEEHAPSLFVILSAWVTSSGKSAWQAPAHKSSRYRSSSASASKNSSTDLMVEIGACSRSLDNQQVKFNNSQS